MEDIPALLLKNLRKDLVEGLPSCERFLDEALHSEKMEFEWQSHDCTDEIASAMLYQAIVKKWEPTDTTQLRRLRDVAVAGFVACNDTCAQWQPPSDPTNLAIWNTAVHLMNKQFHIRRKAVDSYGNAIESGFSWPALFERARTGPGASVGSQGQNSSLEKLFLNRLSTTNMALYRAYCQYLRSNPLRWAAELSRRARYGDGHIRLVAGSTLGTVRKNSGTDRTICTEASLDMYAQLGLGEFINDLLVANYGYCPKIQQGRNRELARRGSRSGDIATLDSTSCSDLIALLMTKGLLHPLLNAAIDDCRAPEVKVDKHYRQLHMVSSMGNGFTFPLMTYIFSVFIEATCLVTSTKFSRFDHCGSPFGVFGDDICVPTAIYGVLVKFLESVGFIPNLTKSYDTGPFRESCGGDYLAGQHVRGVYVRKLSHVADRFSAINRLNVWSARHGILLKRTIRYLLPAGWLQFVVPCDEQDTAGVKTNYFGNMPSYNCLKPLAKREIVWYFRRGRIAGLRRRYDNPFGVLFSTVNGALTNGSFSRRQSENDYEVATAFTPTIWACASDFTRDDADYRVWEIQTARNLGLVG